MLGYTKSVRKKCKVLEVIHQIPIGESLDDARIKCERESWCTGIYQPECKVAVENATKEMYLCKSFPVKDKDKETCLWEKSKFYD